MYNIAKKKGGKMRKGYVTARLPEDQVEELDGIASRLGWTRSKVLSELLSTGMPAAADAAKNGSVTEFRHFLAERFQMKLDKESA
jgi:hypothetical protein